MQKTLEPFSKDPPIGNIVGLERLVDSQPTMKVIAKTARPVTQKEYIEIKWELTNSISFDAFQSFEGYHCVVGPYYPTVTID